jgi:hypothetical protein
MTRFKIKLKQPNTPAAASLVLRDDGRHGSIASKKTRAGSALDHADRIAPSAWQMGLARVRLHVLPHYEHQPSMWIE